MHDLPNQGHVFINVLNVWFALCIQVVGGHNLLRDLYLKKLQSYSHYSLWNGPTKDQRLSRAGRMFDALWDRSENRDQGEEVRHGQWSWFSIVPVGACPLGSREETPGPQQFPNIGWIEKINTHTVGDSKGARSWRNPGTVMITKYGLNNTK